MARWVYSLHDAGAACACLSLFPERSAKHPLLRSAQGGAKAVGVGGEGHVEAEHEFRLAVFRPKANPGTCVAGM